MRGDGGKVGAGGDADPGFPAVRDYLPAPLGGHVADFNGFGQASDAADVRLGDVHFSTVHQVGEFVSGGLPFAGGDANARAGDLACARDRCCSSSSGRSNGLVIDFNAVTEAELVGKRVAGVRRGRLVERVIQVVLRGRHLVYAYNDLNFSKFFMSDLEQTE